MHASVPRIWNTIATGKVPEKHGITSFARKNQDESHLFLSTDRKVHALWNIASEAGMTVGVVNWWNTYPPARIDGVMVSDHILATEIEGRRKMMGAESVPTGALVFPESSVIDVEVDTRGAQVALTVDGQEGTELADGDRVQIRRSPHPVSIISSPFRNRYEILRAKLRWGER